METFAVCFLNKRGGNERQRGLKFLTATFTCAHSTFRSLECYPIKHRELRKEALFGRNDYLEIFESKTNFNYQNPYLYVCFPCSLGV